ncbi:MAG: orotidine-5'-phosphate decarboxylase [Tepidanaerobacter acetatoxydans]|uniref:orotidine-5'-phosphate decarboxylase n=1 Tax=Tepidanaerobacter acetatoxydans TaxID=499229 RepID=UPI0026ED4497|nr:orotidine-5'-phosphate decarboxylase [Tepidanaerobacter acetatoxydans]NLU09748.1 orotidine-5'-phosphate decarboxylase [Tepidanaerobacter acetatoxydans]
MSYDYSKVIIALDTPDEQKALEIVRLLKDKVSVFKVGLELFCSQGPEIVKKINNEGCKVFLDLKLHDIPNTVAGAAKACLSTGAFMLDVHASGGCQMMRKAREAVDNADVSQKPILLAITVLTSLDESDLAAVNIKKSPTEQVKTLALMAKESGLDGVVASPKEISVIREAAGDDFLIVTPGVRPAWAATGDQKRVMTPAQALDEGADYIVVGRPVTAAPDPAEALSKLFQ